MHTMRLKMFRVGSPGSGEQKWPQAFHRYMKNIMNCSYFTQAAGNRSLWSHCPSPVLWHTCDVRKCIRALLTRELGMHFIEVLRSTLEWKDWLCTDFGYTDITSNGEEGTSHYFSYRKANWHISVPRNMTIMVSNAYEEYAAMISGTIIMMYRNIWASVWVHVIPGDSACLLIWVRTKYSMIPVELVSASQSGKGNNISVSGKEMEPGSGESTCFKK